MSMLFGWLFLGRPTLRPYVVVSTAYSPQNLRQQEISSAIRVAVVITADVKIGSVVQCKVVIIIAARVGLH